MIKITGLGKVYGDFPAIRDVSLEIRDGETFALLGPNGSGKSTTLKCLVGLTLPTAGEILIDGIDIRRQPRQARRLISYLPQRVNFPDNLTVREIAGFYAGLRQAPAGRFSEVAASTHFEFNGFSDKPVSTLSGGMLQRLGLLIACLPDVPVLILDEPMINLDPEGAIRFRRFLLDLKQKGKTIIFSSHMLADVEQIADRVGIFVGGRLASVETVENLREKLSRESRMRVATRRVDGTLVEVARAAGAQAVELESERLVITSPPDQRFRILEALQAAGAEILEFTTEDPSLEDFYLTYLRGL